MKSLLLAIGIAVSSATVLESAEFQAGVSVADITPPIPYRMSGYFSERLSTGVKDRLQAKAIVLQQDEVKAALIFCDLIGISLDVSTRTRKQASQVTGIPVGNITIAATHSHTGPLYFGALRDHLHDRTVKRLGSDPHEKNDYADELVGKLVAVIQRAQANVQPTELEAGYAEEKRLSFNRRFHLKDGTVRFNPGQLNPNIVRVAGPIDPQVGIVSLKRRGTQQPTAAIVAFALHLDTVGGTEYSADYPLFVENQLRQAFGSKFISLFGAGTCGDINHVDVTIRGRRSAEEIGELLGQAVVQKLPALARVTDPSLAVLGGTIDVPLQKFDADEIEWARKNMELVDSNSISFLDRVRAYKITAVGLRKRDSLPIEVQVFRLSSDVAVVTLPGEVFVDLGIAIKAASPFKTTLIVELANDAPGYIPTRKAFAEGSYETVNSRIAPGGGEAMVDVAIALLREIGR